MQPPKIRRATPSRETGDYRLLLEFDNGEKRIYDLAPRMESEVFAPLKTRALFERVRIAYGSLEWPGERDLAYDSLYAESAPLEADEELEQFADPI